MATVENLEIIVDVDISKALAKLQDLQDELEDLANSISTVDRRGTEGISVRTRLDDLDAQLTELQTKIEAFEAANSVDIPVNMDGDGFDIADGGGIDGTLSINDMNVAANDVTVVGKGGSLSDAVSDSLSDLNIETSDGTRTDVERTERAVSRFSVEPDAFDFLDMSHEEFLGRSGLNFDDTAGLDDEMFEAFADADLDFGGFNVERGRGINVGADRRDRGLFQHLRRGANSLLGSFRDMRSSINEFDLRMSDLHNMMARLIPLLVVFIGVIPAAYSALVGLASAAVAAAAGLAALTALGALGLALEGGQVDMQNLTEAFQDIQDAFIESFAPLAERLEPLFLDGLSALERFFQMVASRGDTLMELTDEARAFGGFLLNFVPDALQTLGALVEALGPIFGDIGTFIDQNFNQIVRTLVRTTAEAVPVIAKMALMIGRALPALIEMSVGFAQVANVVMQVIGLIFTLVGALGLGPRAFGFVTAAALSAASAIALLNTQIVAFAGRVIASAIISVYQFWAGLMAASSATTYLASTTIGSAIVSVYSFISSLLAGEVALFSFTGATFSATSALAAFLTLATFGAAAAVLVPMAVSAAAAFTGLSGSIDSATSSLKEFDRVSGRADTDMNPYDPPSGPSGAGAATQGGGTTVINLESSGDADEDRSNARYVTFRNGRTTGGNN